MHTEDELLRLLRFNRIGFKIGPMLNAGIYFIGSETGPIKIGFSTNVRGRLCTLQTSSPIRLTLLGLVAGTPRLERQFHDTFREHRLNGEWFNPAPEILALIETVKADPWHRPIPRKAPGRPAKPIPVKREGERVFEPKRVPLTKQIIQLLKATPGRSWKPGEIAKAMGFTKLNKEKVNGAVASLYKRSRIVRLQPGRYVLSDAGRTNDKTEAK